MSFTLVNDAETLRHWCKHWITRPWLAVDTEFVRVDTYQAQLCLIQIGDGERSVCVDPLAIPDLAPLWEVLHHPQIIKVLHSASQDYEIFVELTGRCPAPLFDSQTAATLLGIGDQIGYAGLIEKTLGIAVDKSLSRTNWARRPLTDAELEYAAADVTHLATLYPQLQQQLAERGRLGWLAEDCKRVCDPALYVTRPEDAWQRLKGLARMSPAAQHVAAALAAWRETTARERNRPRKWIVEDDAIYRIAERLPKDMAQLENLKVLPPKTLARHGDALLEIVNAERTGAATALDAELDSAQKARLQSLQNRVRETADSVQLPAGFIAPRADLIQLLLNGVRADIPLLQGWRKELVGAALASA